MIIYLVKNTVNGKCYVGQTRYTLQERWANHCSKNSGCTALKNAICKYGKDAFQLTVIDTATDENELDEKERYWIEKLNTLAPNGYNLKTGGERVRFTEEVRNKLRKANLGKSHSAESRKAVSESMKEQWKNGTRTGHKVSEKSRYTLKNYVLENGAWNKGLPKEQQPKFGKPVRKSVKMQIAETLSVPIMCLETGIIYPSSKVASELLGLHQANISKCLHGERERTGGYHWILV